MAFRLYIGNYPFKFTKEDVQNLFHDFNGVEIEKILHCERKSKSYSFATCKDIDQLVSVIKTLNGKLVSGRTLIIRASDNSLQEYVNLILQNDESTFPETSFIPIQMMRKKRQHLYRRDDYVKSDMYNKCDANSMQSENIFPKSEYKAGVFENNSQKYYQQVNEKSNNDNFKTSSNSSRCSQDSCEIFKQNSIYSSTRDDFVKSGMHNEVDPNSVQSENVSPKSEKNVEGMENKSQKYFQRKNGKSDYGQFKTNSNSSSRYSQNSWDEEISTYSSSSSGRDDFVKSAIHNKSSVNSMQSENVSPKSEYSTGVMENNSQKHYFQDSVKSDYNQFKASSRNSSKYLQSSQEIYEKNSPHSSNSSCYVHHYKSPISNIDSEGSKAKNSGYCHRYRDASSYHKTWVSVSNFRLGTTIETFYELFSDYNPLRVEIVCNTPRKDRALTEAHICFPNRDIADDVIMNFDNTIFEGRVILVNDVEDSTIMDELLDISNS